MSEGNNQPNTTTPDSIDRDDMLDAGDRTEELTQAQQAGYGNKGGLDRKVEDADVGHGAHSGDDLLGDGATTADPTAPGNTGFNSTQGDGPNSQSGASAGSGGTGQRT
jgi:hypothetical protein